MKVYKYPVPLKDHFEIEMPLGAEILSFQSQNDEMMIWAAVWPNKPIEKRKFSIIGTGQDIDMDCVKDFIGTAQVVRGILVWHLFEMK